MIYGALPALIAAVYYLLALVAALWRLRVRPRVAAQALPPISILKPIHGHDPDFYEAIRSHAMQDYPEFEMLFGVVSPVIELRAISSDWRRNFRSATSAWCMSPRQATTARSECWPNWRKLARYPILLVNDSDIFVEPGYLRDVVAPLEDPRVGVVTCLYRARAESGPSRWEAIGLETEFVPSVLVARLIGCRRFALGSTMVFRAEQIRQIGGFEAVRGLHRRRLSARRAGDSSSDTASSSRRQVVETDLGAGSWGGRLAASTALVAHHPRLATGRLFWLRGDACHALGLGGARGRGMADRGGALGIRMAAGMLVSAAFWESVGSYPISG